MKVKDIVKQTEEHRRLQGLIQNIEQALEKFDEVATIDECTMGVMTLGGSYYLTEFEQKAAKRYVDIILSANVAELVRAEIRNILMKHLAELKAQQEALEV